MAYNSKYKSSEIERLLDKVNEGGGGGGSSVFITHFTVDEFISSNILQFTDEQLASMLDAARQNKIIALPFYNASGSTGFLISSYSFDEYGFGGGWDLTLDIVHGGAIYSNVMNEYSTPYFTITKRRVTPLLPLVESIQVDEAGYAYANSYNKDNVIFVVDGECRYLSILEIGPLYGMTVRFFTGEDCTIEYWGNWANGVIPTIEPYTDYEMVIAYGADYNPCAVLTPFKQVE